MNTKLWRFVLPALAALLLVGCGPKLVKGEAPLVQVTSWSIDGTDLDLVMRIRNVNDEELLVSGLDFKVLLDESELVSYVGRHDIEVAANGSESLSLAVKASDDGTELLARLQEGDLKSLPYDFSGSVETAEGKNLRFHRDGHIYTVPGRPGQFR